MIGICWYDACHQVFLAAGLDICPVGWRGGVLVTQRDEPFRAAVAIREFTGRFLAMVGMKRGGAESAVTTNDPAWPVQLTPFVAFFLVKSVPWAHRVTEC
jgi:hypothetical protein